jgi:hypothetical protein
VLGALFPPNGRYAPLVALSPAPDLLICAKDLFVAAITLDHAGAMGPMAEATGLTVLRV